MAAESGRRTGTFTRSALQELARMLSEEHSDRWLADVLAASSADERLRRPFAELKLAIAQNAAGRPGDALTLARQAEALFARFPTGRRECGRSLRRSIACTA
jgi:hypothetical protein